MKEEEMGEEAAEIVPETAKAVWNMKRIGQVGREAVRSTKRAVPVPGAVRSTRRSVPAAEAVRNTGRSVPAAEAVQNTGRSVPAAEAVRSMKRSVLVPGAARNMANLMEEAVRETAE